MSWSARSALLMAIVGCSLSVASGAQAQVPPAVGEPRAYVFASPGGTELKAYVFSSNGDSAREPWPGIVLFYGGGWAQGEPSWAFANAILQGSTDTVTPLPGVKRFCERLVEAKNRCELHVYEGIGHLFTPAGIPDGGQPQLDPATATDALDRADRFLRSLGFERYVCDRKPWPSLEPHGP